MEPKPYHRLGRLSPDTGRYNIIGPGRLARSDPLTLDFIKLL
jgi:hypothetical protein